MDSKGWDWTAVLDKRWQTPTWAAINYSKKWKEEGFRSVLDLGCGLGRNSFVFVKDGFDTTVVDISPDAIEFVKQERDKQNVKIQCYVSDMLNLPFLENYFDCIFAYHVISHQDTEGVKKAFKEICRILKPGGKCFVTLGSKKHPDFCLKNNIKVEFIDFVAGKSTTNVINKINQR